MFFCQRASRSSSSTGARAGGHSDGEDSVSFIVSLSRTLLPGFSSDRCLDRSTTLNPRCSMNPDPGSLPGCISAWNQSTQETWPAQHLWIAVTVQTHTHKHSTPTTQTLSKYIHTHTHTHYTHTLQPNHIHTHSHTYTLSKCIHANHTARHTQSVNTFKPTHKHCPYTWILPKTPDQLKPSNTGYTHMPQINEDNIYKKISVHKTLRTVT